MNKKKNYIVISLYTENNDYKKYAKNLIENLNNLNIPNDIKPININSSIKKNIELYKPTFIKEMMKKHNKILIWCDCDDGFKKSIDNINPNFDVGVVDDPYESMNFTGGIHIWNNTEYGLHKLNIWEYLCKWPDLSTYSDHKRLIWSLTFLENKKRHNNANIVNMTNIFKDNWTVNFNRR